MARERQYFAKMATAAARVSGTPECFWITVALIIIWAISGPFFHYSDSWQLVANTSTTLATTILVLLVQATQNRDAAAIHAKLDEMIRVTQPARNALIRIEELPEERIAQLREEPQ